jgi:thioredoxin 1
MARITKIFIVIILILTVGTVTAIKKNNKTNLESGIDNQITENIVINEPSIEPSGINKTIKAEPEKAKEVHTLPRLLDLGADKCVPCKIMAPMLEKLKKEYAGVFNVTFIDVWKNQDTARKFGIKVIPTQIFYDASGKELYRHEGYYSKRSILAKWKHLSVDVEKRQE